MPKKKGKSKARNPEPSQAKDSTKAETASSIVEASGSDRDPVQQSASPTEAEKSTTTDPANAPDAAVVSTSVSTTPPQPPPPPNPSSTPLHGSWTYWFDNPKNAPPGSDWADNLKALATFRTVEDFWRVYNNVRPPSMISVNSNYSVFRQGIEPAWEHPSNLDGGKFLLTLPKPKQQQSHQGGKGKGGGGKPDLHIVPKLDEYWLFTVLAVLGETMDATGDQVCGAVVSVRKSQDRIALWLKTGNMEICVRIGEKWKKALDLEKTSLRYQTHKDAKDSGRSFRIDVHFEV